MLNPKQSQITEQGGLSAALSSMLAYPSASALQVLSNSASEHPPPLSYLPLTRAPTRTKPWRGSLKSLLCQPTLKASIPSSLTDIAQSALPQEHGCGLLCVLACGDSRVLQTLVTSGALDRYSQLYLSFAHLHC